MPRRLARVLRGIEFTEDAVQVLVAALLAVLAVVLAVDTVRELVQVLTQPSDVRQVVLAVLEETLLLFIVAELLHTVRIALRDRGALNAEPFLVIGVVAAVRRMLVLTAEAESSFRWNPQGIELLILMALVLVMTLGIVLWRYTMGPAGRPDVGLEQQPAVRPPDPRSAHG